VLELLPKARLLELSRDLGVVVNNKATKEDQVGALARKSASALPTILRSLARDELKRACRAHHLDDRGRSREELARRILQACSAANDSRSPSSAPSFRLFPLAGDIVAVRQRQYLVTEVVPRANENTMTVVRLVCLDDDAQGRPLDVLWELELGANVTQPQARGLGEVEALDEPREFAAYFHAVKWNRVTATDSKLFQAPFRAGIALKSYQLTPLRKALELPRANLFIADDVGLGKTIEAGLVVQELLLRQRIDWVLIVCPASVTLQWKAEMERRFGLSFEVYSRDFVTRRRQERGFQVNPWSTHNRFIVSYQTFRRPEYRDALINELDARPKKSMLVLDEAHTAAPATASKYAFDTLTTKAIRDLSGRFKNRLFLSATPHNGHSNSFSALLEMLDPQRFLRGTAVSGPEQLAPVMVRRLKPDLTAIGTEGFPTRRLVQLDLVHDGSAWQVRPIRDDAPGTPQPLGRAAAAELELSELLARYTALACPPKGRSRLVFINLQKRLLSSIEAFTRTLEKHATSVGVTRVDVTEAPAIEDDDDLEGGASSDAEDVRVDLQVAAATASLPAPASEAATLLERMRRLAQQHRNAADAKTRALIAWIREHQCPAASLDEAPRGASKRWTDRRVIIFTEYGHTKTHLFKLLASAIEGTERADDRIRVFDGGMSEENRSLLQEEFNGDPAAYPVRILIATDAAREGVNLQGHCADLFHYDIPWNPGRLEQRNGRIDRTLQSEPEVRCHYFFYPQRGEDDVLRAVVRKVGQIQHDLGSVGAVVFDGIAETLETRGIDGAVLGSIEELEARVRATSRAAKELEQVRAQRLGDEIRAVEDLLNQSRERLEFEPALLREAMDVGLAWAGAEPLIAAASPKDEPALQAFHLPNLGPSWAATLDSARPARRRDEPLEQWRKRPPLPVVFESPTKLSTPVVQLHLAHPIVKRLLARFLAQGFSAHDLARVTVLPNPKDAVPRVIALGRLSIFGHGATRLHDEILAVAAAIPAKDGKLKPSSEKRDRAAIERLEDLFAASPALDNISGKTQASLRARASGDFIELWPHIEHEADAQAHDAENKLRQRGLDEADALAKIILSQIALAEKTINDRQVTLAFTKAEREQQEQLERDRKHLVARKAALAVELVEEPKSIVHSYEVLRRRVEPIGLVYLWPTTR
jgi:superfamily II DNA/RNA helicase